MHDWGYPRGKIETSRSRYMSISDGVAVFLQVFDNLSRIRAFYLVYIPTRLEHIPESGHRLVESIGPCRRRCPSCYFSTYLIVRIGLTTKYIGIGWLKIEELKIYQVEYLILSPHKLTSNPIHPKAWISLAVVGIPSDSTNSNARYRAVPVCAVVVVMPVVASSC